MSPINNDFFLVIKRILDFEFCIKYHIILGYVNNGECSCVFLGSFKQRYYVRGKGIKDRTSK